MSSNNINSKPDKGICYSIVIPAFNANSTIVRAVNSVLQQTYTQWRLIIVDDGSTDNTLACVLDLSKKDERITIICQENLGVAAARNRGVQSSETDYVAFLDADDEYYPKYLTEMHEFVKENPGYDIYHPNILILRASGEEQFFLQSPNTWSFGFQDLLDKCVIAVGGAVVSRNLFDRIGGFQTGIHCEDYEFWLRATATGARALYHSALLYVYHQETLGRRSEDVVKGLNDLVSILTTMLQCGNIPNGFAAQTSEAIQVKRIQALHASANREMALQASRLQAMLQRVFGNRVSVAILFVMHKVTWMLRPLRSAILERKIPKPNGVLKL